MSVDRTTQATNPTPNPRPTPHPLDAAGSVELAVIDRNGLDESRHIGAAVVVDASGRVLESHGDMTAVIYPRSSLKLFQATAVLDTGVRLDDEQTVLATASHSGTDRHVAVVERTLSGAGMTPDDLQCPPDFPMDTEAFRAATEKRRVAMNCSGKHASFLAASVHSGWSTSDYRDLGHPLQTAIAARIEDLCDERIAHSGVDGCGAPVHALTLPAVARGISRIVTSGSALAPAIRAHAWAIDGPGRANTIAIDETGVIAKGGAEGYLIAGAPDGTTVALKILDGSLRAATLVGLSLLARIGALDADAVERAIRATTPAATGGDGVVGGWRLLV